jgi:tubulin polyglutamylase TTLL5
VEDPDEIDLEESTIV